MPNPSTAEEANLERWRSTGEPKAWVWKHLPRWNGSQFLELLAVLRESQHWPMHGEQVRGYLEKLRTELLPFAETTRPLHMAASEGRRDVAELVLGGRPGLGAIAASDDTAVNFYPPEFDKIDATDADGATPLHRAARGGHREVAELLLANGANANARMPYGDLTPLHLAAGTGHTGVVELLLAKGADVNARGSDGATPLLVAVCWNREGLVEYLLANGADVNAKGASGETPLHSAIDRGKKSIVELLRKHGGRTSLAEKLAEVWALVRDGLTEAGFILRYLTKRSASQTGSSGVRQISPSPEPTPPAHQETANADRGTSVVVAEESVVEEVLIVAAARARRLVRVGFKKNG